ncbi:MAG TPA: GtrA family protein [Rudaea sp.]|nr:GtrA family protein [Rudaea sp.]
MRILRDGFHFSAVGVIQVVADSAVYILLTKFGLGPAAANVSGRVGGALLGFWLNGRVTFAQREQPHLPLRLIRYLFLWTVLTAISTAALVGIAQHEGLASSWWCKPLIETALGLTSFLVSRHWVYQR